MRVGELCSRVYDFTKSHTCFSAIADATTHQRIVKSNVQMKKETTPALNIPEILQYYKHVLYKVYDTLEVNKHRNFRYSFFCFFSCFLFKNAARVSFHSKLFSFGLSSLTEPRVRR